MTVLTNMTRSPFDSDNHPANANTIHVGEKPKSISFSGCGFLGVYHIGVASCIKTHAPNWLKGVERIYGCSAGSLIAAMLLSDVSFGEVCYRSMNVVKEARSRYLGPISPGFKLNEILIRDLRCGLPADAHIRATGKLFISLTRVRDGKNVIVSDYKSREELIQVLLCSCFVPFYSGIFPPKYRGVRYVDGGLSNNLPAYPDTITVSPWSGNSDICPRNDGSTSLIDLSFVNTSIQLTASNLYRISIMFFPPSPEILKEFCCQGFRETVQYLRDHGLFETVRPLRNNLSFSSLLHEHEERKKITRKMSYTARCLRELELRSNAETEPLICNDDDVMSDSSSHSSFETTTDTTELIIEECFGEQETDSKKSPDDNKSVDISKNLHVFTVVHMYSVLDDHLLKIKFQVPPAILEALEAALERSPEKTWKKPISNLLCTFHQSFFFQISLDKAYNLASFLIRHAEMFPNHVMCLVTYLQKLVDSLQIYFKCSGQNLLGKLRNVNESTNKEIEIITTQLVVTVQILIRFLRPGELSTSLFTTISNKAFSMNCSEQHFNPRLSPFLQIV